MAKSRYRLKYIIPQQIMERPLRTEWRYYVIFRAVISLFLIIMGWVFLKPDCLYIHSDLPQAPWIGQRAPLSVTALT